MTTTSPDLEAIVRRIVRDVLAGSVTPRPGSADRLCLADRRVVTLADLEGQLDGKTEIATAAKAVITPAARDLLRERLIRIVPAGNRITRQPEADKRNLQQQTETASQDRLIGIADVDSPDRSAAFAKQLGLRIGRGVETCDLQAATFVLADLPQRVVCDLCRQGHEAVQIGSPAEAQRVAATMQPKIWVLDMERLNLVSAANIAKQIRITETCELPKSLEA